MYSVYLFLPCSYRTTFTSNEKCESLFLFGFYLLKCVILEQYYMNVLYTTTCIRLFPYNSS